MPYSIVRAEEDKHGTTVFVRFPPGESPGPEELVWTDIKGQDHYFKSYGRLCCPSMPEGYTYWSDDKGFEDVNVISLI